MTSRTIGRFVTLLAAVLAVPSAFAEIPAAERAETALRAALSSEDEGLRLFALEIATRSPARGLEAAARDAADSNDRVERSLALELLARIDVEGNREQFLRALDSPHRLVRLRALKALASLSDRSLSPRLIGVLEHDPDPDLQALAARGLGHMGAPDAREALYRAVATGHPVVQTAATRTLVAIGELGVGRLLLDRARAAGGTERKRLFGLVALVPDADLVPLLADLLEDPDSEVRVAAAAAILSIVESSR